MQTYVEKLYTRLRSLLNSGHEPELKRLESQQGSFSDENSNFSLTTIPNSITVENESESSTILPINNDGACNQRTLIRPDAVHGLIVVETKKGSTKEEKNEDIAANEDDNLIIFKTSH